MPQSTVDRPVSAAAMAAFSSERALIIQDVVERSLGRADEVSHHGEEAERRVSSGISFTTQMLEAAMSVGDVALLEDQLKWAGDRLPHDGVVMANVVSRFRIYIDVVEERLSELHAAEILPYLRWMIDRQSEMMKQEDTD